MRSIAAISIALTALAVLLLGGPGGGGGVAGPQRADACGVLPISVAVRTKFSKPYAVQFSREMRVALTNEGGYKIGGLQVQLYTFAGFKLGNSAALGGLRPGRTMGATVNLTTPMQPGKVTVVVKGANKGCSLDEISHVVTLFPCRTRLPLSFPGKPGGYASDYGDFLSVSAQVRGGEAIRYPRSRVYDSNGDLIGTDVNRYRVIYGGVGFDNHLSRPLDRGRYTMIVRGWLNQPASCGPKTAQVTMGFK